MRKSVMFLASPRAGFDVVDATDILPSLDFFGHLVEFAVLSHHRMYDSKKAFIGWKDACATSQSIALKETYSVLSRFSSPSKSSAGNTLTLTCVLREYHNDTSTLAIRVLIPVKISAGMTEDSVEFIAHKFIRTKDTHGVRVVHQDSIKKFSSSLETALLRPFHDS